MGFLSWMTCNTDKSISNKFSSRGTFPVRMILPDDTYVDEFEYEGYGVFGGLDFYAQVAQYSVPEQVIDDVDHDRDIGIALCYHNEESIEVKMPKLIEIIEDVDILNWEYYLDHEDCPDQGSMYNDDDDWDEGFPED